MAAIRPTRSRAAVRAYHDENQPSVTAGKPASLATGKAGAIVDVTGFKKNVPTNHSSTIQDNDKANKSSAGVKRPALASKDQQPPRKVSKHTRSSSVTSKAERPAARAQSGPLANSTSLNIVPSTSNHSVHSRASSSQVGRSSRQPSADPSVTTENDAAFSDAPTQVTVDDDINMENKKAITGSGLTPSLTELGVVQEHPSSSRYMDGDIAGTFADEHEVDQASVQGLPILNEVEEDFIDQEDEQYMPAEDDWLFLSQEQEELVSEEMMRVREHFVDEIDEFDCTMVAEYADEIFDLMGRLEEQCLPNANYMDFQQEMDWNMRTTLIDWLLQVHLRYHMLPETLWIAVNIVDRFLSARVVSLIKLQLVGVTAMFIAAKYEEILAPSVDEFVFMTERGYTKDEILKGERIILQTLNFDISSYCSPYSWVRKISKADDYDVQTRTLSKYLMEVTLLDHRFLRAKPSLIAAIGMYLSRRMLDGDWNDSFIYYSGFTELQVISGARILTEIIAAQGFESQYVHKKYSTKKFLRASQFAGEWARSHVIDNQAVF